MDWRVSLLVAFTLVSLSQAEDACVSDALGMASGAIKDEAITASSFEPGSEPKFGRHGDTNERRASAWCPANYVDINTYEWLQVDFLQMVTITHVVIGGEFNDGVGLRYTKKYRIEYQRTESEGWQQFVNTDGTQIFPGSNNGRLSKFNPTNGTLLAARVRIIPLAEVLEEACLRVEFYGCFRQGIASYNIPQGDVRSSGSDLIDRSYDGEASGGQLIDGLGILTDGKVGGNDFTLSPTTWLGWKSDLRSVVELFFEMDHLRNISGVNIFSNNQGTKDVEVFIRATIYTSIEEPIFDEDPVIEHRPVRDVSESSRWVPITFGPVVAKFIKIVLDFNKRWILIGEVTFNSTLVVGPYPQEASSVPPALSSTSTDAPKISEKTTIMAIKQPTPDVQSSTAPEIVIDGNHGNINNNNNKASPVIDGSLIGIIVGSCVGAILVVIFIIIICCIYQRKKPTNSSTHEFSAVEGSTISFPSAHKNHHGNSSEYDLPWSRPLPHLPQSGGTTLQSSGYVSDGTPYASIPVDQFNKGFHTQHHHQTLNPQRCSPCLHHYMTSGGLLTLPGIHHERHNCGNASNRPTNTLPAPSSHNLIPLPKMSHPGYDPNSYDLVQHDSCGSPYDASNYKSSPSVLPHIQGSTGNSVYGAQLVLPNKQLEEELPTIPSDSLRFLEKLGAGQYGEVHLCEMSTQPHMENLNGATEARRLVAVKKLQPTANESTKNDFIREIRIMSKLRHENIVQVLGVCTASSAAESPSVVTEYMSRGDLHQFLQRHVPEGTALLNKQTLCHSTLLHIANQIAQGMSYLEQLNVTHRDLAARNCLVGENYQVKISDFGMSRSLYSQQYYKVEGRVVLPIRWMSWESVLLGKFTTKSDVWSFGVTLWEIFSFAREQPFSMLTDDDVIANCMNYYNNNISEVISLNHPSQCSKEIYDLMQACWQPADFNRPTFKEISLFLQRKATGTNHKQDKKTSFTRLTTC